MSKIIRKRRSLWLIAIAAALACLVPNLAQASEPSPALKELIAAANKEGQVNLSWSQSTLGGSQGAAQIEAAMNKMFGTNIHVNFAPGAEMARIGNQLATEYAAGQKSSIDIYLAAAAQITPLLKLDFFQPANWASYLPDRINPAITEIDGKLIRVVTGLTGVTYNSRLAPAKPVKMEDFLHPEWKGKIATTPYGAGFDVLLANDVWGPQKTFDYARKLGDQISGLIRCGEAERVATGEYAALVMDCTGQDALLWQEKGAPLEQMMPLDAAQQRYYYFGIPKNAQNPNAAKLVTVFMMTEEGQRLSFKTWKADLDSFPASEIGKKVQQYRQSGVKFNEVTIDWWRRHPEIDANKGELTKILTTKN